LLERGLEALAGPATEKNQGSIGEGCLGDAQAQAIGRRGGENHLIL
jgi:hypothetical protein